jgi:hypothetical protein
MEFGVLANRVLGVNRLPKAQIRGAIPNMPKLFTSVLMGTTEQQWLILDGDRLIEEPALLVDDNE